MISEKLRRACLQFRDFGSVDEGIIPPNLSANNLSSNALEAMGAFQIALTRHMADTCTHSINQISICLQIAKILQFYRDDIVRNDNFWMGIARQNGENTSIALQIQNQDIANMKACLDVAIDGLKQRAKNQEENRDQLKAEQGILLELITRMESLAGQAKGAAECVITLGHRAQEGKPYFEPNEKPELESGQTAEDFAKATFAQLATNVESLIGASEDFIRTSLARAFYIQTVVVPNEPQHAELWEQDKTDSQRDMNPLVQRIDTLNKIYHDARWFTGLTFNR